jgi:ferredoxin
VSSPFSCREGLCRSCEVGVISGEVEHRDYVLSEQEQTSGKSMLICVSRAKSSELVLDV